MLIFDHRADVCLEQRHIGFKEYDARHLDGYVSFRLDNFGSRFADFLHLLVLPLGTFQHELLGSLEMDLLLLDVATAGDAPRLRVLRAQGTCRVKHARTKCEDARSSGRRRG